MNRFNRNQKLALARVMIAFSFILISLGTYIYLDNENTFITPIKDAKVISGGTENNISINTTDETEISKVPSKEETATNNNSDNKGTSSKDTVTNNNPPNKSPIVSNPSETPQNPTTTTIEMTNDNLRNQIQSTYGITIKYGTETGTYSVGGLNTIQINDANIINQTLNSLNYNLGIYPVNFFREIKTSGLSLTIYLIKKYSTENVTGVTDSTYNNVIMSLATDYPFSESLNHELYHYIDAYIYKNGGNYLTWNNLNPAGFNYGTINSSYSYTRTGSADAYFVNNYAQTDEYEDRASTFEYMMSESRVSCLSYNKPIWLKAKYMSEQIDLFFNTVSPNITEYWEKFVY